MRATILAAVLILAGHTTAADTIRFPEAPTIPQPMPAPVPVATAAERLAKGQWYVIDSNKPLLVDAFGLGAGTVTVKEFKGPLTIPAEIAVGRKPDPKDPEVVTILGPYVYVVKAAATGKVILDVLPSTNELSPDLAPIPFTKSDIIRRTLEVDAGKGPQPPPDDPVTDPVVDPKPTPTPKAEQLLVVTVEETYARTPAIGKLMLDPVWEGLKAKDSAYLHVEANDPILDEKKWRPLLVDAAKKPLPLPATLVMNRSTGEKLGAFPITESTTPADLAAKFKEFQK